MNKVGNFLKNIPKNIHKNIEVGTVFALSLSLLYKRLVFSNFYFPRKNAGFLRMEKYRLFYFSGEISNKGDSNEKV